MATNLARPPRSQPIATGQPMGPRPIGGKPRKATLDNYFEKKGLDSANQYDHDAENRKPLENFQSPEHTNELEVGKVNKERREEDMEISAVPSQVSKVGHRFRRVLSTRSINTAPPKSTWSSSTSKKTPSMGIPLGGRTLSKISGMKKKKEAQPDFNHNPGKTMNAQKDDANAEGERDEKLDTDNRQYATGENDHVGDDVSHGDVEEEEAMHALVSIVASGLSKDWENGDNDEKLEEMVEVMDAVAASFDASDETLLPKRAEENTEEMTNDPTFMVDGGQDKSLTKEPMDHLTHQRKKLHPPHPVPRPPMRKSMAPLDSLNKKSRYPAPRPKSSRPPVTMLPGTRKMRAHSQNQGGLFRPQISWSLSVDAEESVEMNFQPENAPEPVTQPSEDEEDEEEYLEEDEDPQITFRRVNTDISSITGTVWTREARKTPNIPRTIPNMSEDRDPVTTKVHHERGLAPHRVDGSGKGNNGSTGQKTSSASNDDQRLKGKKEMHRSSTIGLTAEEVQQKRALLQERFKQRRQEGNAYNAVVAELQHRLQFGKPTNQRRVEIQEALGRLGDGSSSTDTVKKRQQMDIKEGAFGENPEPIEGADGNEEGNLGVKSLAARFEKQNYGTSMAAGAAVDVLASGGPFVLAVRTASSVLDRQREHDAYYDAATPRLSMAATNTFDDKDVRNAESYGDHMGPVWSTLGNYGTFRTDIDAGDIDLCETDITDADMRPGKTGEYGSNMPGFNTPSQHRPQFTGPEHHRPRIGAPPPQRGEHNGGGEGHEEIGRNRSHRENLHVHARTSRWTDRVMNSNPEDDRLMQQSLSDGSNEGNAFPAATKPRSMANASKLVGDANEAPPRTNSLMGTDNEQEVVQNETWSSIQDTKSKEEANQIWVITAVSAAAAVLSSGGAQNIAQVAANTLLLAGKKSNDFKKAAAKVSVAILDAGGSPVAAAAAAVAIMEMDTDSASGYSAEDAGEELVQSIVEGSSKRAENVEGTTGDIVDVSFTKSDLKEKTQESTTPSSAAGDSTAKTEKVGHLSTSSTLSAASDSGEDVALSTEPAQQETNVQGAVEEKDGLEVAPKTADAAIGETGKDESNDAQKKTDELTGNKQADKFSDSQKAEKACNAEKADESADCEAIEVSKAEGKGETTIATKGQRFTVVNLQYPVIMSHTDNGVEMFYPRSVNKTLKPSKNDCYDKVHMKISSQKNKEGQRQRERQRNPSSDRKRRSKLPSLIESCESSSSGKSSTSRTSRKSNISGKSGHTSKSSHSGTQTTNSSGGVISRLTGWCSSTSSTRDVQQVKKRSTEGSVFKKMFWRKKKEPRRHHHSKSKAKSRRSGNAPETSSSSVKKARARRCGYDAETKSELWEA